MFANAFTSISPYAMDIARVARVNVQCQDLSRDEWPNPFFHLPIRDDLRELFSQKTSPLQA
jgi:hypothetical protein